MSNRVKTNTVIFLFIAAILIAGWQFLKEYLKDPGGTSAVNTAGMIAAVEVLPNGSQVVAFKEGGSVVASSDYKEGSKDTEICWTVDGNRVFFSSNRKGSTYQIFRWDPVKNKVDVRTAGTRGMASPALGPLGDTSKVPSALVIAGGVVLELDTQLGKTTQVLPPAGGPASGSDASEGGGSLGQFERIYEKLGQSFKEARYGPDKSFVLAVMRRDGGEVLILQRPSSSATDPVQRQQDMMPKAIFAGKEVQFEIAEDGAAVIVVRSSQPVNLENPTGDDGKLPKHAVYRLEFGPDGTPKSGGPVLASQDDNMCFADPALSADGNRLVVAAGTFVDGINFTSKQLLIMPFKALGGKDGSVLANGFIRQPSWSPNSDKIAYMKMDTAGKQSIWTVDVDGTGEKRISPEGRNFNQPLFSPQRAK